MEIIAVPDAFATKGVEYLIVIGFLVLLVAYWRWFGRIGVSRAEVAGPIGVRFRPPTGYWLHRGHTWAAPLGEDRFRVGIDDLAGAFLGPPARVELPKPGQRLRQGDVGWTVVVEDRPIRMLSPLNGVVEEVNEEALERPGILSEAPYEDGWLLKVRATDQGRSVRNLLSDRLAGLWLRDASERLGTWRDPRLGVVLPEGGPPVSGFGRIVAPDGWDRLAERMFLTEDLPR